ncbi:DUF6205 family protein [Streptacidiphilus sp. N1-3]|uniref:DUF6205 family protein n=1 Tax=Streptacidiphilus alkalitolerans TaxID=3342712 RepID=A0ABV6XCV2_9ACTN
MGTITSVTGEITITPALTWNQIRDSAFNPRSPSYDDDANVHLYIEQDTVQTDEGPLQRLTASALIPATEDPFRAYRLIEHVQQLIDAFPGHQFTGRLDCMGDDAGDLWRVVLRDRCAVKVKPQIIWPED